MGKLNISGDSTCGSVTGNIVIGEINMAPRFGEVIVLRVGPKEKYKTIGQAIVDIPRDTNQNYEILCSNGETIKVGGAL